MNFWNQLFGPGLGGGSGQIDESIGSSVNETNIDTSTAATTVMPNE